MILKVINNREKGDIAEDLSCRFLIGKGFIIKDRNYRKKWGEIDIIAAKDNKIHFFEVKSSFLRSKYGNIADFSPENRVGLLKVRKLRRIIETYLSFSGFGLDYPFQFHIICVFINKDDDKVKIKLLKDIII